ncbi:DUF86 domain-containing protein [Echinicola marina]|uniref:HepT-like ribonuclease domain-containing protein n=1 Tax=Echinicola marina TaxID=2859768 RepID=UPI001CF669BA|nr:HepT-like ribonuclease domain-containing protein [Echinicola marina]UCS91977.1 DUF86 domain-containing protein [Echinicola marina]
MDDRIEKCLYDVAFAIEEIEAFIKEYDVNTFFDYKAHLMLKRAVERNLEIIGEAVKRILKRNPAYEKRITQSKAIISLRNHVIHAYDGISDENIWSILINHLPKLKREINSLMYPL